jgi:hypothetical protein
MANRSTFNSSLPREIKRIIDLTPNLATYNKNVTEKFFDKEGKERIRVIIQKDYGNALRSLFLDAHKTHKRWHSEMLTKKTNESADTTVESVESASAT